MSGCLVLMIEIESPCYYTNLMLLLLIRKETNSFDKVKRGNIYWNEGRSQLINECFKDFRNFERL